MVPFNFSKSACFLAAQNLALYHSKKQLSLIVQFMKIPLWYILLKQIIKNSLISIDFSLLLLKLHCYHAICNVNKPANDRNNRWSFVIE